MLQLLTVQRWLHAPNMSTVQARVLCRLRQTILYGFQVPGVRLLREAGAACSPSPQLPFLLAGQRASALGEVA